MAKIDPLTYHIKYTAYGTTSTMSYKDPQEDGVPAKQKAQDYMDAAMCCDPDGEASCTVTTEEEVE